MIPIKYHIVKKVIDMIADHPKLFDQRKVGDGDPIRAERRLCFCVYCTKFPYVSNRDTCWSACCIGGWVNVVHPGRKIGESIIKYAGRSLGIDTNMNPLLWAAWPREWAIRASKLDGQSVEKWPVLSTVFNSFVPTQDEALVILRAILKEGFYWEWSGVMHNQRAFSQGYGGGLL